MKLPNRTLDTMSEAIALSSPNGSISKRAQDNANERLRKSLFGEGLKNPQIEQPDEIKRLKQKVMELKELADRGMHPLKYRKEAKRLEQLIKVLTS